MKQNHVNNQLEAFVSQKIIDDYALENDLIWNRSAVLADVEHQYTEAYR